MFTTNYGNFNGTSWEQMFQVILKRKFMAVSYQTVKASPGDFGIEGYTKDGQVFQCYCPEVDVDNNKLYEQQRDKITKDIAKLKTNCDELERLLGGVKIKKWIFITPRISSYNLTAHCIRKRDELKSWKLPIICDDLEVLVHEVGDYEYEIGEYLNSPERRLMLRPDESDTSGEKVVEWKGKEIDMVKNALLKNEIRVKSMANQLNASARINELTNTHVKNYLNGVSMMRRWSSAQPENHQRFVELMASVEEDLRERCLVNEVEPNAFTEQIASYMEEKVRISFTHLDESSILRLRNYAIASWILRCPLYFEIQNYEY